MDSVECSACKSRGSSSIAVTWGGGVLVSFCWLPSPCLLGCLVGGVTVSWLVATSRTGCSHSVIAKRKLRQTRVLPIRRRVSWSLVCCGSDHARKTLFPLRVARKSCTSLGNCNDGGRGAPGEPQPSTVAVANTTPKVSL